MRSIKLSVLLTSITSVVIINRSTKNFCEEYIKNGHKIDFGFRFFEDTNYDKTESRKYFIIGNTSWQLTYIDGSDKTVTIDSLNITDDFDWLSGKQYTMAWTTFTNKLDSRNLPVYCGLQKDMKSIDWWFTYNINIVDKHFLTTSTIVFPTNFKPIIVWSPIPIRDRSPIVTFLDNNSTLVYDFSNYSHPTNTSKVNTQQMFVIEGKRETEINKVTKLMAIFRQYSQYDYNNGKGDEMGGQGSIVFTNVANNTTIKYCYVGNPYNETACKPENLKILIDCRSHTTTTTISITTIPTPTVWFKWLKTTLLIAVNVILLILICLMIYLIYNQWLQRYRK
ncbi:uncharacterized protein LOC128962772 [Oppia nitens]|uniref:uncharacterized protein LOC128962772 n=1 Tax=Oppia nitens TaxID=1686743 RepID=UPI0023DB2B6E|nr:uncharacterized protein LOC128962772 [Oppia nitens]